MSRATSPTPPGLFVPLSARAKEQCCGDYRRIRGVRCPYASKWEQTDDLGRRRTWCNWHLPISRSEAQQRWLAHLRSVREVGDGGGQCR